MKQHRFLVKFISLALALMMIGAAGAVTAFAVPGEDPEQPDYPQEENGWYEETPEEYYYNYYEDYEDATSAYEAPEALDELPAVSEGEVQQATSVSMPLSELPNNSLFSGIVLWLCVALGIAVIVGVLVSRRTHRRG